MHYALIILLLVLLATAVSGAEEQSAALVGQKGVYSVESFGAKGDGKTDDTAAFQNALDEAGKTGGVVFVPAGGYLIKGRLNVPARVAMEGVFKAPPALSGTFANYTPGVPDKPLDPDKYPGSMLLAVDGRGSEAGKPFLFLHGDSVLKGLAVYYPEQDRKVPVPYPWCVGGEGDNCSIVDCLLVNPWNAVDFGSRACGRHFIKGLYAQPIKTGIFVDKCLDVGRIEDVHLWPFWDIPLMKDYTLKNGTAFIFGRTDWEYVSGCFCIFFKVGFHFEDFKSGPANAVILNSGSDLSPCSVLVEKTQGHSGISFTNCQFMAGIEVKDTNGGPIKFTSCGFWGLPKETINHAHVQGHGHVTFNGCNFITWDAKKTGEPAIFADGRALTVIGCDFIDSDKHQITLGEHSQSAIITGNLMRGGIKFKNLSKGKLEMGLNAED